MAGTPAAVARAAQPSLATRRQFAAGVDLGGNQDRPQLLFDFVLFRKAIGRRLGEDEPIAKGDFKDPSLARQQVDTTGDLLVVIMEDILRQTGGTRQIPSGGAVRDPHLIVR